jgi:RNA recognition motif-containing protein
MTGRPRGFALVTMSSVTEGRAAIDGAQGKGLAGRPLVVNEAHSNEDRPKRPRPGPYR